jgi:hypothetical protein
MLNKLLFDQMNFKTISVISSSEFPLYIFEKHNVLLLTKGSVQKRFKVGKEKNIVKIQCTSSFEL